MKEAINTGLNDPDPTVQARWETFQYMGAEPTIEEFILWMAISIDNASEMETT